MKRNKSVSSFPLNSKTALILGLEIFFGVIICLISLYLFLKIGNEVINNDVLKFDTVITDFIYSFRTPIMTNVMLFFTFIGSALCLFVLSALMIFFIGRLRAKDAFIYLSILYSAIILNLILKLIYQRPRPDNFPLIHEGTMSFPSGHAMNSFVFFAAFTYFIFRENGNVKISTIIGFFSIILIILIGISRIYLGVHFPSDVIGGWVAGFLWFISAIIFEKIIIARRFYKNIKNEQH